MAVGTITTFLSRLCGGELYIARLIFNAIFLSRLCGGELGSRHLSHGRQFLSRLCGGEQKTTRK